MPGITIIRGPLIGCLFAVGVALVPFLLTQPGQPAAQAKPRRQPPAVRAAEGALTLYVSPGGTPEASGTREDPRDLQSVLASQTSIPPGSLIWLLGGTYGDGTTYFFSRFQGTEDAPVILRQVPGERASLNGSLIVEGSNTWFWGFEVMSTITDRTGDRYNPSAGTLDGVFVNGPYTKLINLKVHDTREGIALWTPAVGAEVYDCIIYNNGWQGPDRGHGHGIYTQNKDGVKRISGNIIFNQFGIGIHAYGSDQAFVQNYLVEHNVVFNNGVLARDGRTDNLFFGSGGSLSGIRVENNYTYHTPSADIGVSRIGWQFGKPNDDVTVLGNYFIGGYIALEMNSWTSARVRDNVTYAGKSYNVLLQSRVQGRERSVDWDRNRHYGTGQFLLQGRKVAFAEWQAAGLDVNGLSRAARPSGVWSFLRQQTFDPGMTSAVIYNWDLKESVCVDATSVLPAGAAYRVYDAQNIYGPPVLSGVLENREICFPMANLPVAMPLGVVPNPPSHTAPEFGVFVIVQE